MEMTFSRRLDLFGPEIFAALNDKKIALEVQGRTLYNLSVGTPDFPPAPHIKQALLDAAADPENWKYSLRDIPEMLQAVCSYYKRRFGVDITPGQVASCNGSQEGCGHIGMVLCDEGDTVLLPNPCYPVFIAGAKLAGAVPFYYPLVKEHGFLPYVKGIPEDVARRAKYMIVSLPANPVGSVGTPALYEELVAFAKKYDILLIHDNAYSDIIFDGAEGWHDWMRGIPGAEAAALRALKLCHERGLQTDVEMCIHRGNQNTLPQTIEALRAVGVQNLKVSNVSETPLWCSHCEGNALTQQELDKLSTVDQYPSDSYIFSSHGYDLLINNELVAEAFASPPEQEQSILILHCVLEMADGEIGSLMGMSRSAVQRHRTSTLKQLRVKLMALMPGGR